MHWLFDISTFLPRGRCCFDGELAGPLGILMQLSSAGSVVAFLLTALTIQKCKTNILQDRPAIVLYAQFLQTMLCLSALSSMASDIVPFYFPAYRAIVAIDLLSGTSSLLMATLIYTFASARIAVRKQLLKDGSSNHH